MSIRSCAGLACLVSIARCTAAPGPSPETVLLEALPRPCQWLNTREAFKVLGGDAVAITAPRKTDLYNDALSGEKVGNAPMLVFPPDQAFVLTVKVSVAFKAEYDGGFLIVYGDPEHWAKLLFEKSHYGPNAVGSGLTYGTTVDCVNGEVAGKEVFLRIARSGALFTFYMSTDGLKWNYIQYFKMDFKGEPRVGFASQSPVGEACTAVFSGIRYVPKPAGDFWTGEPGS